MGTSAMDFRVTIRSDHRRVLSDRLRSVEQDCVQLLELLRPFDSALIRRRALPHEKAGSFQRLIADLRSKIVLMADNLGLQRALQDAAQEAKLLTTRMSASVAEMHPDRLAEYGPVPDDLAQYLEAHVEALEVIVAKISQLLAKPALAASGVRS